MYTWSLESFTNSSKLFFLHFFFLIFLLFFTPLRKTCKHQKLRKHLLVSDKQKRAFNLLIKSFMTFKIEQRTLFLSWLFHSINTLFYFFKKKWDEIINIFTFFRFSSHLFFFFFSILVRQDIFITAEININRWNGTLFFCFVEWIVSKQQSLQILKETCD